MTSLNTTVSPSTALLKAQLTEHKLAQYMRLSGGIPIPLAGALYWAILAWTGTFTELEVWAAIAFPLSGLIFPLALIFAKILKCNFMKDKSAVGSVLLPTFISMLLFWPMLIMTAKSSSPELIVPILAIGMSRDWHVSPLARRWMELWPDLPFHRACFFAGWGRDVNLVHIT